MKDELNLFLDYQNEALMKSTKDLTLDIDINNLEEIKKLKDANESYLVNIENGQQPEDIKTILDEIAWKSPPKTNHAKSVRNNNNYSKISLSNKPYGKMTIMQEPISTRRIAENIISPDRSINSLASPN